jgi:hypothetical protein
VDKFEKVTIVARGELTILQRDIILRYLGRQGLRTRIIVPQEHAEAAEPLPLGTARQEDFQQFQTTDERYRDAKGSIGTKSFDSLWRAGEAAQRRDDASRQRDFKGLISGEYELNLDLVAKFSDEDRLTQLPNFGAKSDQFVRDFIEFRRESVLLASSAE